MLGLRRAALRRSGIKLDGLRLSAGGYRIADDLGFATREDICDLGSLCARHGWRSVWAFMQEGIRR
jgi:hypothetical protein